MTAMATANKPFDLTSAEPSGYYINYPEIRTQNRQDLVDRCKTGMTAPTAAKQLVDAVIASGSPGKLWIGTMAWFFRRFWPLLSVSIQDRIAIKTVHADQVRTPVIT